MLCPCTLSQVSTQSPHNITLLFVQLLIRNTLEKIPNTGSYTWYPASDLENDTTHYGIQLIADDTGFYQYTTQFGIYNPGPAVPPSSSSSVVIPTSSSVAPVVVPTSATTAPVVIPTAPVVAPTAISSSSTAVAVVSPIVVVSAPSSVAAGTTTYSTRIVTITSCGTAVTNCPAITHLSSAAAVTSAPVVVTSAPPAVAPPVVSWSNSTLITTSSTPAGVIASTGFGASTVATAIPTLTNPNAGDKIRVGCAMGAVLVAAFGMFLPSLASYIDILLLTKSTALAL